MRFEDRLGGVYLLAPWCDRPRGAVRVTSAPETAIACAALRKNLGALARFLHRHEHDLVPQSSARAQAIVEDLSRGALGRWTLWRIDVPRWEMQPSPPTPPIDLGDLVEDRSEPEEEPMHWLSFDVLDPALRPIEVGYRASATGHAEREGRARNVYRRWERLAEGACGVVDLAFEGRPAPKPAVVPGSSRFVSFEVVDDEGYVLDARYVLAGVTAPTATPTRVPAIEPAIVDLEILARPRTRKSPMSTDGMNIIRIKWPPDGAITGLHLPLDKHTRIIVERPSAVIAQIEPACFGAQGCILLPVLPAGRVVGDKSRRDDVLAIAAAVLQHAADNPDREIVVAAHDDAADIASQRGENVRLLLAGDREGWAAHCHERHALADHKHVHAWAAQALGWPTDPGPIDDARTDAAKLARDAFRSRCNAELGTELEVGVTENAADWEAVFDLYDRVLARALACEVEELAAKREAIVFGDPAAVGCASAWPKASPVEEAVVPIAGPRVDVLSFLPEDVPPDLGASPPAATFYDGSVYARTFLAPLPVTYEPAKNPTATFLELHDVCFGHDRSLMVPASFADERQTSRLLGALIVACRFAQEHPEKVVLVAGHTDTTGADDYNQELAEKRATNVHLWLSGQRDAWAADCQKSYMIADFKAVHRWAHEHLGWNTDPGAIDESWHDEARVARDVFRTECEALLGITLEHGVKQNEDDWRAIHDLYALVVARYLDMEVEELAALREGIAFTDPATLGCGESFPRERPGEDGVDSAANRRVEIVFFDPGEVPALDDGGATLYAAKHFTFDPLVPESLDPLSPAIFEVDIRVFDHWHRAPLDEVEYTLTGPLPERLFVRSGTTDADGGLFEPVLPSGHYELAVGESKVLVISHPVGFSDPSSPQPGPKFRDVIRMPGHVVSPVFPERPEDDGDDWEIAAPTADDFPDIGDDDVHTLDPEDRAHEEDEEED